MLFYCDQVSGIYISHLYERYISYIMNFNFHFEKMICQKHNSVNKQKIIIAKKLIIQNFWVNNIVIDLRRSPPTLSKHNKWTPRKRVIRISIKNRPPDVGFIKEKMSKLPRSAEKEEAKK